MFLHNLLNVLVQIANKMGLQKKGHGQVMGSFEYGNGNSQFLEKRGYLDRPYHLF
jgi:hypothetical protein